MCVFSIEGSREPLLNHATWGKSQALSKMTTMQSSIHGCKMVQMCLVEYSGLMWTESRIFMVAICYKFRGPCHDIILEPLTWKIEYWYIFLCDWWTKIWPLWQQLHFYINLKNGGGVATLNMHWSCGIHEWFRCCCCFKRKAWLVVKATTKNTLHCNTASRR